MSQKDYFVGLDIGTESVGWAVTDTKYHMLKQNGRALWGVRLFEEAQPAADRRMHRIARRRIERQKQRIEWLQQVFNDAIAEVDPAFFQRLKESKFLEEDKQSVMPLGRYTLFCDKDYCDRDYHRDYPTIYHLRKDLLTKEHSFDVRLVYLAVHHILKYRGHFLFGELALDAITFEASMSELYSHLEEEYDTIFQVKDMRAFQEVLTNRSLNTTQKKRGLFTAAGIDKGDKRLVAVVDLLAGRSTSISALYGDEVGGDELKKISLQDDFEMIEPKLLSTVGERAELVRQIKKVYDWALLAELRDGEEYLSSAKVNSYEKHKADLKKLKKVMKAEDKKLYYEVFRAAKNKLDNYPAYSGHHAANYRCDYDKFKKFIEKKLKAMTPQTEEIAVILAELDAGTFLPKQTTKGNGVIPHQLHELELRRILERASRYLPFLNEIDRSGLSRKDQILQMFCFRIPYYVGPVNSASPHSWVVRAEGKIYPWNFEQVVNLEECAERFITRMTAKCSYIGEDVLPKESLLYSKFMVLNELNNLKISGEAIPVKVKQDIYQELFLIGKKVTQNKLKGYLISKGLMTTDDSIGGIDGDVKGTLASYAAFSDLIKKPNGEELVEDMIHHIVLFGEDRKLLASWLKKTYGHILSESEQKTAIAKKFSGWGRLSRQFLTELYHVDPNTGEALSIMEALWKTNDNLMELLSSRYTFGKAVDAYRKEKCAGKPQTLQEYLDESYASPGIKRAIHQTMGIMQELSKIMKCPPKRIFVEVAREEGEKKRTVSRRIELLSLYKKCGEEASELFEQLENRHSDGDLRRDKLYLYYTQLGRCMYSGEPIDLSRLDVAYDIEHIYPQSYTKDDSLQNRVLVKRELNAAKSNTYPIEHSIREKMRPFWDELRRKGFISHEKYERLTRSTPFGDDELAGFIARQLVETRQSSKIVAELLSRAYGDKTEIVYVKAGNVSTFRQDQRMDRLGAQRQAGQCKKNERTTQDPLFIKNRDVNDFHHAKDAYLNIVVGNVYHVKFTKNPIHFIQGEGRKYSLNRMFDFDVIRGGECAWKTGEDGTIATVHHTMSKNNILFTRMSREVHGQLFDQMMVPKGNGKGKASIKSSDPRMTTEKFGGYNKITGTYFCLVEHSVKKKRIRSIEAVYLMQKSLYERDPVSYCKTILGLEEPIVLISRIKVDTLVSFDGFRMHISGRTGSQIIYKNANQLVADPEHVAYFKKVGKYLERCKNAKMELPITIYDGISREQNILSYQLLLSKLTTARYAVKYTTAAVTISKYQEVFEHLSLQEQCRVLMQLLNLFACNASSADLELLCGKSDIGKLLTSKNLDNYDGHSFKLIHQSITGVFEQEFDLLGAGDAP